MTATVDVVIVGDKRPAISAAIDAARQGFRVVVVVRSERQSVVRPLRRAIRAAGPWPRRHVRVVTGAEVVCVDGVDAIEAVVVRHVRTGQLTGFNSSALLSFERPSRTATRANGGIK